MTAFSGKPLSVGELTAHLKNLIEKDSILSGVWVEGEISNLVKASSGHHYFTLKDEKATLRAALWAGNRARIPLDLKNGQKILAFGALSVYPPRGEYQIIVTDIKASGLGALFEAFEKLKVKLAQEGLFDESRKIPLPFLPCGIGIITSSKGAVVQDIFRVVRRRFPNMPLYLVPVKVQGEGASQEIAGAIKRLDADPRVDVIIVGRGGGSIEDLWAFNEEETARAIANALKPIVSAVGHETDTTIADFVADRRASTPSQAGEFVVPVKADLQKTIEIMQTRLGRGLKNQLTISRQRLNKALACRFLRSPHLWFNEKRLQLANLTSDLENRFKSLFRECRHAFELLTTRLQSLNPGLLLERGFVMVTGDDGQVVSRAAQLRKGQAITLGFHDGVVQTLVQTVKPRPGS